MMFRLMYPWFCFWMTVDNEILKATEQLNKELNRAVWGNDS